MARRAAACRTEEGEEGDVDQEARVEKRRARGGY